MHTRKAFQFAPSSEIKRVSIDLVLNRGENIFRCDPKPDELYSVNAPIRRFSRYALTF